MAHSLQDTLKEYFDRPTTWYVEVAGYLIAGFIIGFLVKYGGRLFGLLLVGALLALWTLDYFEMVTIHYSILKQVLGVSPNMTFAGFLTEASSWIRGHIIESLTAFFGFMLAWKYA